jgi:hypothetical protein
MQCYRAGIMYQGQILFADIDSLITGKHDEFFVDLAHMTKEGEESMGHEIADTILKDYRGYVTKSLRTNKNSK